MTIATVEHASTPATLAHTEPGANLITWAQALSSAHQIATALCNTSFVPRHFSGKPDEAAAALMLGDELGLAPVSALRSIFVIGGTPGMYARTMVALVQSRGHQVWTDTDSPTKVVVCGQREGSTKVERSEWSIDRARKAGYTNNKKYETDPQAMLYARAASDVCRRIAADVLSGIPYSVEEMELEAGNAPAKTVKRQATRPAPPEPDIDSRPAPSVTAEHVPDEPPLDGPPLLNVRSNLAKAMYAAINDAGIPESDRIAFICEAIGREVTSSKEITEDEARKVLDYLPTDVAADAGPADEPGVA